MDQAAASLSAPVTLTVARALELPAFREGVPEVLAGHGQLDRPIRWVHSGEFPDMPAVLKGGELLLTHGMSIPSSERGRRRYLADLARAEIAALVIELGSATREIPREIVDEARSHELPLIVLHRPIPWIEVTETIHGTIVRQGEALLERGQELHERFVGMLAAGAGVAELLQTIAEMVGNPVVLSHGDQLMYTASRSLGEALVTSAFHAGARGLSRTGSTCSAPVSVSGDPNWGRAVVLPLERPIEPLDRVTLERAAPVLALAFLRAHESEALAARDRGDFLDALLDADEPLEEHQAYRRAATLGLATRSSWLLPVTAEMAGGFVRLDERRWALVASQVRDELESRRIPAVVGTLRRQRHIALILGLRATELREPSATVAAEAIKQAVRRAGHKGEVVVCVGRPAASWRAVRQALRETVAAIPAMRQAAPQPWHDVSAPSLHRLLWALGRDPAVADFSTQSLAPLVAYDARRGTQLVHTLSVYCACGGHKAQAARNLHLERQSLYKRLAKIEELLGANLEDEDTLLGLHLALRVRPLLADQLPGSAH